MNVGFDLLHQDPDTPARRGQLRTTHGLVQTPVFMPVGTVGSVKGISPRQLDELQAEIILGNTYHLMLRPGMEVVEALGGLHKIMAWDRPILTDSGGFQVFSLRDTSRLTEDGVTFASHLDGRRHHLTPERSIAIQETLGSDIVMAFDHLLPGQSSVAAQRDAMDRTTRWAKRAIDARQREDYQLFGIIQGGIDLGLRRKSLADLTALPFDGYALGGLSVGETREDTWRTVAAIAPEMPRDKARYLMGVGTPEDLLISIGYGIDMFDCVLPTRNARNGRLMTQTGDINIRNQMHRLSTAPIDEGCTCYTCQNYSRGTLRHLNNAKEILYSTLGSIHNLHHLITLTHQARRAIEAGNYRAFADDALSRRGYAPLSTHAPQPTSS